jgi:hypothetical protein
VKVVLLARDLMIATRIADAGARAGTSVLRLDDPADLPSAHDVRLLLVDWADRRPGWSEALAKWCADAPESARPRVLLFGPHTDLVAHADARAAGLGPMRARSSLIADLPALLAPAG